MEFGLLVLRKQKGCYVMRSIIYLVGLVVIVLAIVQFVL